jgi:ribosomal protein S18 acetylase RimI-like enzyme
VHDPGVELRDQIGGAATICRDILGTLPQWFGIPASVDHYIEVAERAPTVVASIGGAPVGFVTVVNHGPYASEVFVMGVRPERHREGIGRRMLQHAEVGLARAGVEYLQVKTLSPSAPDENYAKTRAFYLAYGFRPLEEFPTLWGPGNPALQLIKTVSR